MRRKHLLLGVAACAVVTILVVAGVSAQGLTPRSNWERHIH